MFKLYSTEQQARNTARSMRIMAWAFMLMPPLFLVQIIVTGRPIADRSGQQTGSPWLQAAMLLAFMVIGWGLRRASRRIMEHLPSARR